MFYKIVDAIFGTKKPNYQRPYSQEWDAVLNLIMDEGEFIEVNNYCAEFLLNETNYSIWSSNYPYGFGYAYHINGEAVPHSLQYRPKDSTMRKLKALVDHKEKIDEERTHKWMEKYIYGKD
jgi:hypothetical protein